MKLIRDRTPALLPKSTRLVTGPVEREILTRAKLMEEAAEVASSTSNAEMVDEFGDLMEVMQSLMRQRGITPEEVEAAQEAKWEKKGGFALGVVLEFDPPDNKYTQK